MEISGYISPKNKGLTPFPVRFTRKESGYLTTMIDDGFAFRHPDRNVIAIVWAESIDGIRDVLSYHYGDSWMDLTVLE